MKLEEILSQILSWFKSQLKGGDETFWAYLRKSPLRVTILLVAIGLFQLRGLPQRLSTSILDSALIAQPHIPPKHVRLIVIDDRDYAALFNATSPLDPKMLRQIVVAIWKGKPALIVIDLDTSHPKFSALDVPSEAPIVWGESAEEAGGGKINVEPALGGRAMTTNWTGGVAAVPNDDRGIVRGYRRQFTEKSGALRPSVEWAAARIATGNQDWRAPLKSYNNDRLLDFRYQFSAGGPESNSPMSLTYILQHADQPGWPEGLLHDKVVVLGGTYRAARDVYATPVGLLYGSQIVAQATEAEISGTSIAPASRWTVGCLQFLAGLAVVFAYHKLHLRAAFFASISLVPFVSMLASLILFHRLSGWLLMLPVLSAMLIVELYSHAAALLDLCRDLQASGAHEQTADGAVHEAKEA